MLAEIMKDDEAVADEVEAFFRDFDHRSEFFQTHFLNIAKAASQKAPALRSPRYGGFNVVSSFNLMQRVSQPADFPSSGWTQSVPRSLMPDLIPANYNPPEHGFYRSALNPLFSPSRIAKLQQEVEDLTDSLVSKAIDAGGAELVRDIAMPLTGRTSLGLFGFEPEDWRKYNDPIHNATYAIGTEEDRRAEQQQYGENIANTVAELIKDPNPDTVVGALCTFEKDGRRISQEEINKTINNLIIGGLGTTQAAISTSTVYLARNPDRRQELIDSPELIPAAVNEFIRVFSPTPFSGREVARDIEIGGHLFRAGEPVLMFRSAANWDPDFVERPYEIDFRRKSSRMASLGVGMHMCLGQHLARLEFSAALRALLKLAPNFELGEKGPKLPPNFGAGVAFIEVPLKFNHARVDG